MTTGPSIVNSIDLAADRLRNGDLVAIPTETVYGLAADATNPEAVAKVFELKGRPQDHPLIVHCHSAEQAWRCAASLTVPARRLGKAFWPGPLTVILPKAEWISPLVTGGQDSVAVRVPSHPVTLDLLKKLNRPVVAPSANRFGKVSPTMSTHVRDEFMDSNLMILEGGPCNVGIESTIVDCRHAVDCRILRPGKITQSEIDQVLSNDNSDISTVSFDERPSGEVRTSGNLPSHYCPTARVILVESGQMNEWFESNCPKQSFVISTSPAPIDFHPSNLWYQLGADTEDFARELYALLRDADEKGFVQIVAELPPDEGVGRAIRDRLTRAANQ